MVFVRALRGLLVLLFGDVDPVIAGASEIERSAISGISESLELVGFSGERFPRLSTGGG